MTDEKQKDEAERWNKEAQDALAPPGTFTKGSHHYPNPGGSSDYRTVPPIGNKATLRKLGE